MIIEHLVFRASDGVTDEQVLAADRAVQQEFAPFQRGFVRRTTARDGADWLVETFWYDVECATAAADASHGAPAALRACMDPSTVTVRRFETLE